MRETRAVPTPHKSPVCCPIWLAGFPPNNSTAALHQGLEKCAPGSGPGSLPGWRPAQASLLLSFSASCPGHSPSSSLPSPACPSSSPSSCLLCLTPKASMGDLPGGPWAPLATRKPTAKVKPIGPPSLPLECPLEGFLPEPSVKVQISRLRK